MDKAKQKDDDINKAILEWIISKNYKGAIDPFLSETSLKLEDATKGGALEKKWGTILVMQSKISTLEHQLKDLKSDMEKYGGSGGGGEIQANKVNENIVSRLFIQSIYEYTNNT